MKAFIFDVGHVVMNFNEQQALSWREALRHFCLSVPLQQIRRQLSEHGQASALSFFPTSKLSQYGSAFIDHVARVFRDKYQERIQVRSEIYRLIETLLEHGMKIGLVSSDEQAALVGDRRLMRLESFLKTKARFAQNGSNQALADLLSDALICQELNDPESVVVICATPALARVAQAMEFNVVGLTSNGFEKAELHTAGCDEVCSTPNELLDCINAAGWLNSDLPPQADLTPAPVPTLQHLNQWALKF